MLVSASAVPGDPGPKQSPAPTPAPAPALATRSWAVDTEM